MRLITMGKLTLGLLLAGALAGCLDVKVDVALTSTTTAEATVTQTMGADFYAMVKLNAEEVASKKAAADDKPAAGEAKPEVVPEDQFCAKGALTENKDGSATCVTVETGKFADLTMGNDQQTILFTPAGPGLVRVSLPLAAVQREVGANEEMDAETADMLEAFLKGHAITLRFGGGEITDTNMTLAKDKQSAEQKIDFLELINGTADLPDELYAVVKAP